MSRYTQRPQLIKTLESLPTNAKILDIGGWFDPLKLATHIVDLFPYETRNAMLFTDNNIGENFSKGTWLQANCLDPNLKLPFADNFFDFVVCCHTLEDFHSPLYLLNEIKRIAKAGYIEVPSRLHEQTLGVRDRASHKPGHPHHYWIIDKLEDKLNFYSKKASLAEPGWEIPLLFNESLSKTNPLINDLEFYFEDSFDFEFISENDSSNIQKALNFTSSLNIPIEIKIKDDLLRFFRRCRNSIRGLKEDYTWYDNIITLSEPFSSIPLR